MQFWGRHDRGIHPIESRSAAARVGWIAVASLVSTTAVSGVAFFIDEDGGAWYAITMIAGSVPVAAMVWVLSWHYFRVEFSSPAETGLGVTATTRCALAMSALGGMALAALSAGMTEAFPPPRPLHESPLAPLVSNGDAVLTTWLLSSVLVAPLAEEMFFRGVLFGALSRKWGFFVSATLSASAFAMIHLPQLGGYYSAIVSIALLGFAAAVARRIFASLWAAIALHASYNLALSLYGLLA